MKTNRLEVKEVKLSPKKVSQLLEKYRKIEDFDEMIIAENELSNLIITYVKMELPELDKNIALAILDDTTTLATVRILSTKLDRLHDLLILSITGICDMNVIDMLIHYVVALKGYVFGLENQIVEGSFNIPEHYNNTIKELDNDTLFKIYKLTHETYNV